MILVDTSVWIDHLHSTEHRLVTLLEADEVGAHRHVLEELALGHMKQRDTILGLIGNLWCFPQVSHEELMVLIARRELWGRGLSAVAAHVLGSAAIVPAARVWTRDKRLLKACRELGVPTVEENR